MLAHSVYKVPGGKLLKVTVDVDAAHTIVDVRITGDFFAHPEEAIEDLEASLRGTLMDRAALLRQIQASLERLHIQLFGLDAAGLAEGILRCRP
jgi:hypothetical protein